jgi:hypothetical protein
MQDRNDLNQPSTLLSNTMSNVGGLVAYTSMTDIAPRATTWVVNPMSVIELHLNSESRWGDWNYKTLAMDIYSTVCDDALTEYIEDGRVIDVDCYDEGNHQIMQEMMEDGRVYNEITYQVEPLSNREVQDYLMSFGFQNAVEAYRDEGHDFKYSDDFCHNLLINLMCVQIRDTYLVEIGSEQYPLFVKKPPPKPTLLDFIENSEITCGECFICKEDECLLITLPCKHEMGKMCYSDWMVACAKVPRPPSCPYCNADFKV